MSDHGDKYLGGINIGLYWIVKLVFTARRYASVAYGMAQCLSVCHQVIVAPRSSAIAEGPRDASCQLKSCQLPRNSAETTYTTSPDQIDGMKLEI